MLSTIQSDTEAQVSKVRSDARSEADRIISESKRKAEEIMSSSKQQSERDIHDERMRELASARLESNRRLLEARDEILKGYEERSSELLSEFTSAPAYKAFFLKMLSDGVSKIGPGAVVQINPRDKALLKDPKLSGVNFEVSADPLKSSGGVVVYSKDGKRRVDNTIESIFDERKDELRLKLTDKVFGSHS
jgi:V/A-type H+/Na+-transporting ATPase subunit E